MPARRRTFRSAPRRKLVWARSQILGQAVATAASPGLAAPFRFDPTTGFQNELQARMPGYTVARIRGIIGILGVSTSTQSVLLTGRVGTINEIVRGPNANDNAFDLTTANTDYFVYEPLISPAGATNPLIGTDSVTRLIDIKARRKFEEVDQTLVFDVSGRSTAAADTFTFFANLSLLLMMP